jgi:hypothetical protein
MSYQQAVAVICGLSALRFIGGVFTGWGLAAKTGLVKKAVASD